MTIARFRAKNDATDTSGGSFNVTKPSGTIDGDWLIAVCGCSTSGGQTIALPAGFTSLYAHASGYLKVGYRLASGEGASYSFTASGGSGDRVSVAAVLAYKGCDTSKPPAAGVAQSGGVSLSVLGEGMAAPSGAAINLHIGFAQHNAAGGGGGVNSIASIPPPGFKERVDINDRQTTALAQIAISDRSLAPGETTDQFATLSDAPTDQVGMQLVLFQAPLAPGASAGDGIETLIEMTVWDEGSAAEVVKRYSDRGVIFSGNEFYETRIQSRIVIEQSAADIVGVGGRIATTVSEVLLDNKDHALDDIHERMLAIGRTATIKTVTVNPAAVFQSDFGVGALSNAATVFKGVVAAMTPVGTNMRVAISDLSSRLSVPLQRNTYPGTTGLGGDVDLKGLTKPFTAGRVYNIQPQPLGTVNLGDGLLYTFQVNSTGMQGITAVRERGLEMTEVGVAPGAGQWRQQTANGTFQVGFTPNGIITADVQGDTDSGTYANQTAEVVRRMLVQYGPMVDTFAHIDDDSFADIDAFLPGEIGIHIPAGAQMSAFDAIERVLRSGVVWLSGGRNQEFRLSLASPGPAERLILTEPDIVSLRPVPLPSVLQPLPRHVDMKAETNWFPLSDISSGVTSSQRRKLASPGKTQRSTSTAVQTRQLPERTWTLPGLWRLTTDAQARADQLRTWVENGLRAIEVETDRYRNVVELGMGCEIVSYPRHDLDNGFYGVVAGWRETPSLGRVTMMLIG